jgi:predicted CopG family antitoxin
MAKSKRNENKAKVNLSVREEQRNKLEQMASLEKRSVSNLIEVMAGERQERLAEQQGVAYAKTVAEAMKLKLDMDNPGDREKLRRAILDLVAGSKMPTQKATLSVVDCYFHH